MFPSEGGCQLCEECEKNEKERERGRGDLKARNILTYITLVALVTLCDYKLITSVYPSRGASEQADTFQHRGG